MLDTLDRWCRQWRVNVNKEKSKIVHFRPKNSNRSRFKFVVGPLSIDYAENYKYLGVTFSEYNDFDLNATVLAESASRALGVFISRYKSNSNMGYGPYTKLFDSCIVPILAYGSEIWGYKSFKKINQVHYRAIRVFLGVHRFAPVPGLEGDMGWLCPLYRQWYCMLSFWNRLIKLSEDRLTRKIFEEDHYLAIHGHNNWCSSIFSILQSLELEGIFYEKALCDLTYCKDKMFSNQEVNWKVAIRDKPKLRFYTMFKEILKTEMYVKLNLSAHERSLLAQIRFGILPIKVETGRFNNIQLDDRKCEMCNANVIEDECHFLFECERYSDIRNDWGEEVINKCPDFLYFEVVDQLKYLFENMARSTAKFVRKCFMLRQSIVFN